MTTHAAKNTMNMKLLSFFFLVQPLLPNNVTRKGLLLHVVTHNDTATFGGTPLDEGSARRRVLYRRNLNFVLSHVMFRYSILVNFINV